MATLVIGTDNEVRKPGSGTAALSAPDFIPLCVPRISGNAWVYVKECLDTGWVSSAGNFVDRFEEELGKQLGVQHVVATMNGTSALHLSLLVAGVRPEDEVLTPTLTFVSPANAIRYCGAWPVFMDVDPNCWQMDPEKAEQFLENECEWREGALWNRITGRRVRAILPVHVLGHPCDMDPILQVASKYNLGVIEDASEGLGAKYAGHSIGTLGDIGCLSFNGNKVITTGGGGALLTDNESWAMRARHLSTQAKEDGIEYSHDEIGYNYRMVNLLAALGCAQLEHLNAFIERKRKIATRYRQALNDLPAISFLKTAEWAEPIEWLFTVYLNPGSRCNRRKLMQELRTRNIETRPIWTPLHRLPIYAEAQSYRIEVADRLHAGCLSLPCSASLSEQDQQRVIDTCRRILLEKGQ